MFTSLAIEETKDGRKSMREFRRQVTAKPGKVNWSIIKTNEVYHNVFVHHRNSTPLERRMLELEEILHCKGKSDSQRNSRMIGRSVG